MFSGQCAVFSVKYEVCSIHCAVCTVQCSVCSVQCAVCSVQCDHDKTVVQRARSLAVLTRSSLDGHSAGQNTGANLGVD